LFWKKKDKPQTPKVKAPADNRQAYRINPTRDEPIILDIGNQTVDVVDISSGGLSFENKGFEKGQQFNVRFTLPLTLEEIEAKIEILRIGNENMAHCRFVDLPQDLEDTIHKYVLDRQKEELQF